MSPLTLMRKAQTLAKQVRRQERELEFAAYIAFLSGEKYGVIYADANALDSEVIERLAAKHCVIFVRTSAPEMLTALAGMAASGFKYKSHVAGIKSSIGAGLWFRDAHELLLVGVRGRIPAPAPGSQFPSVVDAPTSYVSEKPEIFQFLIESYFPNVAKVELFPRGVPRAGWSSWGA